MIRGLEKLILILVKMFGFIILVEKEVNLLSYKVIGRDPIR